MADILPLREVCGIVTAFLTALIETPAFYLSGYRDFREWIYFACINVISNIMLTGWLYEMPFESDSPEFWAVVALCESAVVILEFAMFSCLFWKGAGMKKLFAVIFFTNALSFSLGLLMVFTGILQ